MAQRAAERSDEPHKQLAHRSSHTPIHHLPQDPFWGTPWRMPRHTPELLSSSVSEALRRAGACLRPLSSKTPGTMEPKDSPLHATSHCQPGLEVPHKGNAGVWMLAGAPSAPAGLAVGTELNGRHCGLPSQS